MKNQYVTTAILSIVLAPYVLIRGIPMRIIILIWPQIVKRPSDYLPIQRAEHRMPLIVDKRDNRIMIEIPTRGTKQVHIRNISYTIVVD